jgi:hypothetical protein
MSRTVTNHEMDRRKLVANAQSSITNAMSAVTETYGELTVLEWLSVLSTAAERVLRVGLSDEWGADR